MSRFQHCKPLAEVEWGAAINPQFRCSHIIDWCLWENKFGEGYEDLHLAISCPSKFLYYHHLSQRMRQFTTCVTTSFTSSFPDIAMLAAIIAATSENLEPYMKLSALYSVLLRFEHQGINSNCKSPTDYPRLVSRCCRVWISSIHYNIWLAERQDTW